MNPRYCSGLGFNRFAYLRRFFNAKLYGGRRPKSQTHKAAKTERARADRKAVQARKRRNKGGQDRELIFDDPSQKSDFFYNLAIIEERKEFYHVK